MSNHPPLKVKIRDAEDIVYEGEADRISSTNEDGKFDVYPMHANFISIVKKELILYRNKEKVKELKTEQAILKVKQNEVHIFLGIEIFSIDE